jgi:Holliday junction resolvase
MPNRNKAKGNAFERKVCELLMETYGGTWRRSPTSGAFFGGKNFTRLEGASISQAMIDVGDIIPPSAYEGVVIECKSRKDFAFNLLLSSSTELESWIDQAMIDYEKFDSSKVFLVIFKVNRKGMFVVTLKDEIPDDGHTGIDYHYDGNLYRISVFNEDWLMRNKPIIDKRCE